MISVGSLHSSPSRTATTRQIAVRPLHRYASQGDSVRLSRHVVTAAAPQPSIPVDEEAVARRIAISAEQFNRNDTNSIQAALDAVENLHIPAFKATAYVGIGASVHALRPTQVKTLRDGILAMQESGDLVKALSGLGSAIGSFEHGWQEKAFARVDERVRNEHFRAWAVCIFGSSVKPLAPSLHRNVVAMATSLKNPYLKAHAIVGLTGQWPHLPVEQQLHVVAEIARLARPIDREHALSGLRNVIGTSDEAVQKNFHMAFVDNSYRGLIATVHPVLMHGILQKLPELL